jgi:hypothetical protein
MEQHEMRPSGILVKLGIKTVQGNKMICSVRSFFLLVLVLAVSVSFGLAQTVPVTRIQEDDPSISYSGTWYQNLNVNDSGGSAVLTNHPGARAVVSFTGTGISWIGEGDTYNGVATITLDGQQQNVQEWAAVTIYQKVVFTVSGLAAGPHKLSIEVIDQRGLSNQGAWVWLDAFDIQQGAGVAGGLPAATSGRIENDNPHITYTGVWDVNINPMHSGGSAALATNPGAAASLNFNGTAIAWIAYRDEWSGMASVIVDGQPMGTIDTYLSPGLADTAVYSLTGLPAGNHSLTIQVLGKHNPLSGGNWVWLDAFDIGPTAGAPPPAPLFTINSTAACVGAAWTLRVSNARPSTAVSLSGTTNGQPWGIPQWTTTDANGSLRQDGVFGPADPGSYTLTVGIGGKMSNTIFFVVSNCSLDH